ncbi:MAG: NmrA/HSCARG family protein [Ktedonobacteraceae bacterium]|nr:NmrA/HSCARG family protein [Ktedonobacteraceae bacterium]
MQENRTILVTGATGRQGGAVLRNLRARGWKVRALVRDPARPAAQQLAKNNVELIQGDLFTSASLEEALKGVYGVFSVQTFAEHGVGGEIIQGKLLADAARYAQVQHFVHSSVGGAERESGVPHFESKWQVEKHIRALGLPATILRPVFFMDNFASSFGGLIKQQNKLSLPLHPETRLQLIATENIGSFAALAFEQPTDFLGKALEIAGDELSMTELAETFSRVMGRTITFVEQPMEQLLQSSPENALMMQWFNEHGYQAMIPALRALCPSLLNVEAWLRENGWQA